MKQSGALLWAELFAASGSVSWVGRSFLLPWEPPAQLPATPSPFLLQVELTAVSGGGSSAQGLDADGKVEEKLGPKLEEQPPDPNPNLECAGKTVTDDTLGPLAGQGDGRGQEPATPRAVEQESSGADAAWTPADAPSDKQADAAPACSCCINAKAAGAGEAQAGCGGPWQHIPPSAGSPRGREHPPALQPSHARLAPARSGPGPSAGRVGSSCPLCSPCSPLLLCDTPDPPD